MKKLISLLMTLCITLTVFSSFGITVYAESGTCGENVSWKIDDGVLTFSGSGAVEDITFAEKDFHTVVFDDRITSINSEIFQNCYKLTNVTLPKNLVYIPYKAFYNCSSLRKIDIPENVSQIASKAFLGTSLDMVTIPQNTLLIGCQAFGVSTGWIIDGVEYTGIKDVYYGGTQQQWNNIKIVSGKENGYEFYADNDELKKAAIHYNNNIPYSGKCGDNATWKIENKTLYISGTGDIYDYCSLRDGLPYPAWLTYDYDTIQINEGITHIGAAAFDETVVAMDEFNYAFGSSLTEQQVAENELKRFSSQRVYFTIDHVRKVILPKSLSGIGSNAFWICNKLTDVYYAGTEQEWNNISNNSNAALDNATMHYNSSNGNDNFTGITFNDKFYEYDGSQKELLISGTLPEGASVSYIGNKASEAGTYDASAIITADGYNTLTLTAKLTIGFNINDKNLPISGYEIGKPCDNCWTFAQNVYNHLWGATDGKDLLRALSVNDKTITEKNTRNFILSSDLGANIRIEDGNETNEHSMILAHKNSEGFTVYHGNVNGKIEFTHYTYSEFANTYVNYKYFTYIKFPDAPEYTKTPQNIIVSKINEKNYGDDNFTISVTPDATAQLTDFIFESDNTDVAEVSEDGKVTIKSAGETNITVKQAGNDEYAAYTDTQKFVVNKKPITVTDINTDNKTATLSGVLPTDIERIALDFNKLNIQILDTVDENTSNISLTNFVLTGEQGKNYIVTSESITDTIANDKIVAVEASAENGTVNGVGKYLKGSSVTLLAIPNNGYSFSGWYNGNTLTSGSDSYTLTVTEDTILTAKFSKKSTGGSGGSSGGGSSSSNYTVKFETNGATAIQSINVRRNSTITAPATPEKDGYEFSGWYTDKDFKTKFDFATKITSSMTLYAKWTEKITINIFLTIGKKEAEINGKTVQNDVAPKIVNDRTMLPIRFIAESLGADVEWIGDTRTVKITDDGIDISIVVGDIFATVNNELIELDSPSFIENDRTYLPIRFVSEKLGADVEWNESTQTVMITK